VDCPVLESGRDAVLQQVDRRHGVTTICFVCKFPIEARTESRLIKWKSLRFPENEHQVYGLGYFHLFICAEAMVEAIRDGEERL
jgi:hypothetical protein